MTTDALTRSGDLAERYDVVVIGAGPAGLAAAIELSETGALTLLLDENQAVGGQIYRGIEAARTPDLERLGSDYACGLTLADQFRQSRAFHAPRATVWDIDTTGVEGGDDLRVSLSLGGSAASIRAGHVILATGAMERPMPFPGWTKPGVMTAGAAQIALKTAGLVPKGKVVVAGSGPLLYLLTSQLLDAGSTISAVLDTTPRGNWLRAAPHAPGFAFSAYVGKGLKLLRSVRTRVKVTGGVDGLEALGSARLDGVRIVAHGKTSTVPADLLLIHNGVIPNTNFSNAIGCEHRWSEGQRAFVPVLGSLFETSIVGVSIAGDGGGIAGAAAAEVSGRIAALGALMRLDLGDRARHIRAADVLRRRWRGLSKGRAFLDTLYAPNRAFLTPGDDLTVVCRCEEITAGQIRGAIELGVAGPNQLKTFLRCGMGPCQGRLCATTISEMISDARKVSPAETGTYRLRAPVKPVRLAEIAGYPTTPEAIMAVTGSHSTDHVEPNNESAAR